MSFYRIDNNHPWDDKHQVGWGVDLQARLSEWHFLYKRVPKPDSWIWSYWDTKELRRHIKDKKMSYMRPDWVRELYRLYPEARRGPHPSNELVSGGPFEGDGIMHEKIYVGLRFWALAGVNIQTLITTIFT